MKREEHSEGDDNSGRLIVHPRAILRDSFDVALVALRGLEEQWEMAREREAPAEEERRILSALAGTCDVVRMAANAYRASLGKDDGR